MSNLLFKKNDHKGLLFTFCGLDGCGKTTMINLLKQYLSSKGQKCIIVRQPSETIRSNPLFRASIDLPFSEKIDYRAVSMMCVADKLQHTTKVIEPLLYEGYTVISDRYYYSSLANLIAYGFSDEQWVFEISKYIIKPDYSIFLDAAPELAIKRVRARENEKGRYIDSEFQKRLAVAYKLIASINDGIIIDCNNNAIESFLQIKKIIKGDCRG